MVSYAANSFSFVSGQQFQFCVDESEWPLLNDLNKTIYFFDVSFTAIQTLLKYIAQNFYVSFFVFWQKCPTKKVSIAKQ